MAIKLLPGAGVTLPWADQQLQFGMTAEQVHRLVGARSDLHDAFVCGARWAKEFTTHGLRLALFAGDADALVGVSVRRQRSQGSVHVPVDLDGIDLIDWPVDEVIDALRQSGRRVRRSDRHAWVDGQLHLGWGAAPTAGGPMSLMDDLCLYARSASSAHTP
jgi:hypothetical protein